MPSDLVAKIRQVLEPLVGSVLADVSIDLESQRLGKSPGMLTLDDLPQFAQNLEVQLRLVVGPEVAHRASNRVMEIE